MADAVPGNTCPAGGFQPDLIRPSIIGTILFHWILSPRNTDERFQRFSMSNQAHNNTAVSSSAPQDSSVSHENLPCSLPQESSSADTLSAVIHAADRAVPVTASHRSVRQFVQLLSKPENQATLRANHTQQFAEIEIQLLKRGHPGTEVRQNRLIVSIQGQRDIVAILNPVEPRVKKTSQQIETQFAEIAIQVLRNHLKFNLASALSCREEITQAMKLFLEFERGTDEQKLSVKKALDTADRHRVDRTLSAKSVLNANIEKLGTRNLDELECAQGVTLIQCLAQELSGKRFHRAIDAAATNLRNNLDRMVEIPLGEFACTFRQCVDDLCTLAAIHSVSDTKTGKLASEQFRKLTHELLLKTNSRIIGTALRALGECDSAPLQEAAQVVHELSADFLLAKCYTSISSGEQPVLATVLEFWSSLQEQVQLTARASAFVPGHSLSFEQSLEEIEMPIQRYIEWARDPVAGEAVGVPEFIQNYARQLASLGRCENGAGFAHFNSIFCDFFPEFNLDIPGLTQSALLLRSLADYQTYRTTALTERGHNPIREKHLVLREATFMILETLVEKTRRDIIAAADSPLENLLELEQKLTHRQKLHADSLFEDPNLLRQSEFRVASARHLIECRVAIDLIERGEYEPALRRMRSVKEREATMALRDLTALESLQTMQYRNELWAAAGGLAPVLVAQSASLERNGFFDQALSLLALAEESTQYTADPLRALAYRRGIEAELIRDSNVLREYCHDFIGPVLARIETRLERAGDASALSPKNQRSLESARGELQLIESIVTAWGSALDGRDSLLFSEFSTLYAEWQRRFPLIAREAEKHRAVSFETTLLSPAESR